MIPIYSTGFKSQKTGIKWCLPQMWWNEMSWDGIEIKRKNEVYCTRTGVEWNGIGREWNQMGHVRLQAGLETKENARPDWNGKYIILGTKAEGRGAGGIKWSSEASLQFPFHSQIKQLKWNTLAAAVQNDKEDNVKLPPLCPTQSRRFQWVYPC